MEGGEEGESNGEWGESNGEFGGGGGEGGEVGISNVFFFFFFFPPFFYFSFFWFSLFFLLIFLPWILQHPMWNHGGDAIDWEEIAAALAGEEQDKTRQNKTKTKKKIERKNQTRVSKNATIKTPEEATVMAVLGRRLNSRKYRESKEEISKVPTQWSQVCQEVVFCGKAKPGHLSQS